MTWKVKLTVGPAADHAHITSTHEQYLENRQRSQKFRRAAEGERRPQLDCPVEITDGPAVPGNVVDKQFSRFRQTLAGCDHSWNIHVLLHKDGDVAVVAENDTDKTEYRTLKKPKEILEITKLAGIELTPVPFFNLLVNGVANGSQKTGKVESTVSLTAALTKELLKFDIDWSIVAGPGLIIEKTFELELANTNRGEADRIARMIGDLDVKILKLEAMERELAKPAPTVDFAKTRAEQPRNSNLLHITVHNDKAARDYEQTTFSFKVDKKHPDSILVITANLCVLGINSGSEIQIWTYGDVEKTVAYGQSENYNKDGDGLPRNISGMCVIDGHKKTGPQTLTLSWRFSNIVPFYKLNPYEPKDGIAIGNLPPTSVVRVEELLQ